MISSRKLFSVGLAVALVVSVVGLRWAVVDRYGMDLPENDQWDAEGIHLLLPWYQNRPMLPELFTAHNEHYLVLTKLLNLGVTVLNGQWDQRLEDLVNAFLPAALALAMFMWARRFIRPVFVLPVAWVLAGLWGLPLAWQNVIAGFHSQQFFLLGLAFATIVWLPFAKAWSARWWLGAVAGIAGLLSMASGFFAAVVVLILLSLRFVGREVTLRAAAPSAAIALAVTATGWLSRHEVYYHAALKAQTFHDFAQTIILSLQWPATSSPWFGGLLWFPWFWLAASLLRRRSSVNGSDVHGWMLLGLGGWVWLQLLATAYARGADGPPPAVRYLDTLVLGCLVNLFALEWLGRVQSHSGRPELAASPSRRDGRRLAGLITVSAAWLAVFGWGAYREGRDSFLVHLPIAREYEMKAIAHTRAYVASHDLAFLNDPDIPYPGADSFAERIDRPELSRLLPVSVRQGIALEPATGSAGFELSDNARPLLTGSRGPFGVIPGMTTEVSASEPPLHCRTWSSFDTRDESSTRKWTSLAVAPQSANGWLVFAIIGDPLVALELRDASSNEVLTQLRPSNPARWKTVGVRAPTVPFVLHAPLESSGQWLGFSEPVVMSNFSFLAWRLTMHGHAVAASGLIAMALCSVGLWLTTRRKDAARTSGRATNESAQLDEEFYRGKSWGTMPIRSGRDLPSLKLRYLLELLGRRTKRSARLLEVGSGSGRILSSIRAREPDLQLTGIDLSAEQTDLARSVHPDIEFVCGNGESLPFADGSFDYVIFFDYLEHTERPRQSLAEIQRVLKPGGYLHLVCPTERQSIYGLSTKLFGRHFKERTAGHIQQFSRRQIDELVRGSGLSILDRRYSYHLLGSLMDYTLFALMVHPRIYAIYWSGNPYYAKSDAHAKKGFFQRMLGLGNAIAYVESMLFGRVATFATAVHLTARKPG